VNTSGIALRPVRFTLGNLEVFGLERIEARFGAVDAASVRVLAEGEVVLDDGGARQEGPRAEWRDGQWRVSTGGG